MINKHSRFLNAPELNIQRLGRPFNLRGGVNPFPAEPRLQEIVEWRNNAIRTVVPGSFQEAEPDQNSDEWGAWDWNRQSFVRGLNQEGWILNYIKNGIEWYGLDVILRLPQLPFDESATRSDFLYNWGWSRHPFWTDDDFNLIQISTEHGPSWIEFIASDFKTPEDEHHHISLCYRKELYEWYYHLWDTRGKDVADDHAVEWYTRYNVIRGRYDGKRARLKGILTRGLTLRLDAESRVEGLNPPYVIWDGYSGAGIDVEMDCDPDVLFVHTLPGNNFAERIENGESSSRFKAQQHMHISLLLG